MPPAPMGALCKLEKEPFSLGRGSSSPDYRCGKQSAGWISVPLPSSCSDQYGRMISDGKATKSRIITFRKLGAKPGSLECSKEWMMTATV